MSEGTCREWARALSGPWTCLESEVVSPEPWDAPSWRACNLADVWPEGCRVVWYQTVVDWPAQEAGRFFLRFEGVDYRAQVWFGGEYLGAHEGYCGGFEFDVSAWGACGGSYPLQVRVELPAEDLGAWPGRKRLVRGAMGQHPGHLGAWQVLDGQRPLNGGIWGSVALVRRAPGQWQSFDYRVVSAGGECWLQAELGFDGTGAETRWDWTLSDPDGVRLAQASRALGAGERRLLVAFRVANPRWWWSWDHGDSPFYRLEWSDGVTTGGAEVALRVVGRDASGYWWLNGRRVFLRGAYVLPGWRLADGAGARARQEVAGLRACGLNTVRVHGHMAHPDFYRACDEAGILVIQDAPLYGGYEVTAGLFEALTRQVRDLVNRCGRHPSIIGWGVNVGDEREVTVPAEWAAQLFSQADATRPVLRSRTPVLAPGDAHIAFEDAGLAVGAHVAWPARDTLDAWVSAGILGPDDGRMWGQLGWFRPLVAQTEWDSVCERGQQAQARFLLDWVDEARRRRFVDLGGFFYYWLADAAAVIGPSLRDGLGRCKAAYAVLAAVAAPLYPSLRLGQSEALAGLAIVPDIWVLNDGGEDFDELRVQVTLLDADGNERSAVTSVAFDVSAGGRQMLDSGLLEPLPTHPGWHGSFRVEALILRFGRPLAAVERELLLLPRDEGQAAYLKTG